jgi:hypothetical protein
MAQVEGTASIYSAGCLVFITEFFTDYRLPITDHCPNQFPPFSAIAALSALPALQCDGLGTS